MASASPERPTISVVTHIVLLPALLFLVAATRQNGLVRLATLLGYVFVTVRACQLYSTGSSAVVDYTFGGFLGTNCFKAWWLLFYADLEEIRYKDDKTPLMKRSLLSRMYWLTALWFGLRGVGWSVESAYVPPKPGPSRTRFLVHRTLQLAHRFVLVDIIHIYRYTNPIFALRGGVPQSLGSQGLIFRFLNVLAYGANGYCTISIQYLLMSILAVASGFSEPAAWPDMFGNWSDAYTVRRFWGRTWHQMLRRVASGPGTFVARQLGFARGSWLSSRTQLVIGFCVTGMTHVPGDWMLGHKGGSFPFFIVQALGITIEDTVADIARMVNPKIGKARWTRIVGYLWTIAWFTWSTVWFADWMAQQGIGRSQPTLPIIAPIMKLVGIDVYAIFESLYSPIALSASS